MKSVMTLIVSFSLMLNTCVQSQSQDDIVGGSCEGCEAATAYGDRTLTWSDTIPGFKNSENKIKISGTVFKADGNTPAKDIILYVYHTDDSGRYPTRASSKGYEKRHGYMRTWLKTNAEGRYEFYTSRPASYPNSTVPQHIHIIVKEPGLNSYYVEDFYFADDPNLTPNIVTRAKPRGGSGVLRLNDSHSEIKTATRAIVLGLNIPDY